MPRSAAPGSEAGADGQAPVVGGARNPQQMAAQKRLQQTQAQVDEVCILQHCVTDQYRNLLMFHVKVVGIMRVNVEKVLERDQKLSELDDRAGELGYFIYYYQMTITTCSLVYIFGQFILRMKAPPLH